MPKDRLLFAKEGRARYISHLDLMRTFQRAFVRADVPIKHTEGFNPHPFISIALPLSLGFSSRCEILEFGLLPGPDRAQVPDLLNAALPEGVRVLACYAGERPIRELAWVDYALELDLSGGGEDLKRAWTRALDRDSWLVEKPSKKAKSGVVTLDIPTLIKEFHFTQTQPDAVQLRVTLAAQNPGLNPSVLVNALTAEFPDCRPDHVRYGRVEVLDGDGAVFR